MLQQHQEVRVQLINACDNPSSIASAGAAGPTTSVASVSAGATILAGRPTRGIGPVISTSACLAVTSMTAATTSTAACQQADVSHFTDGQRLADRAFRSVGKCQTS
jgi:hypothetical protein